MPVQQQKVTGSGTSERKTSWQYDIIPAFVGGINASVREDVIDASELVDADNVFSEQAELKSETGYIEFAAASAATAGIVGKPRKEYIFRKANGTTENLLFSSTNVFKLVSDTWHYISNGTETTTTATAAATDTQLEVTDTTGFTATVKMGVILDDGSQHKTTIASVDDATHLTMDDAIPAGRSVAIGVVVMEAATLATTVDADQFSVQTITAQDWVVFTNGTDAVKKYDGSSISDLGGLSTVNVDTCVALVTFHAYLLLLSPTVSGTKAPQTVYWCDTGAYETWNSGNAGNQQLLTSDHILKRGELLGPYLILYRDKSIVRCELVEQLDKIFDFETVVRGEGIVSHDGLVVTEDRHIVWGNNAIYEYIGDYGITPISDKINKRIFGNQGELEPSNRVRVMGRYAPDLLEIWFFYPSSGNSFPNKLLRYRLDTRAFWIRTFPINIAGIGEFLADSSKTWSELVGTWAQQTFRWTSSQLLANAPITILCEDADGGSTFEYDLLSIDDDGTTISWQADSKDFFNPYYEVVVDGFDFRAAGNSVDVSYSVDGGDTWIVYGNVTLTASVKKYRIFGQFMGNTVRWRFSGEGSGFRLLSAGFRYKVLSEINLDS